MSGHDSLLVSSVLCSQNDLKHTSCLFPYTVSSGTVLTPASGVVLRGSLCPAVSAAHRGAPAPGVWGNPVRSCFGVHGVGGG